MSRRNFRAAMNSSATTGSILVFKKAGWREAGVLLAVAALIPLVVHLVPWTGPRPLGVYLLPMFWTTFVAVYFYGAAVALAVALVGIVVNFAVTGQPAGGMLGLMALELAFYAIAAAWAVRRMPRFVLVAPLAFLVAKIGSAFGLSLVNHIAIADAALAFERAVIGGAIGLLVLTAINLALATAYPRSR
jgi:hypothetical protein